MSKMMTAGKFRKIVDRFHEGLTNVGTWANLRQGKDPIGFVPLYDQLEALDSVWRDLNRHCAMMEDAERRIITHHGPAPLSDVMDGDGNQP